jgi:hypothetical protein
MPGRFALIATEVFLPMSRCFEILTVITHVFSSDLQQTPAPQGRKAPAHSEFEQV